MAFIGFEGFEGLLCIWEIEEEKWERKERKGKERKNTYEGVREKKGIGDVEVDKVVGIGVHRGRSVR